MFNWLRRNRRSINDPTVPINQAYHLLTDGIQVNNLTINKDTVLASPAVWRGVNLIAGSVSRIPIHVYRREQDESRVKATKHPAYRLIRRQPNELYHANAYWRAVMTQAILLGNSYSWIERNELGIPTSLLLLDPESTYFIRENGRPLYVTTIDNDQIKLRYEDVAHFHGITWDGINGIPLVEALRESLGLGLSLQRYATVYFKNGGKPSVAITLPPQVRDQEKIEQFRKTWGQLQTGLDNAHRPALLQHGAELSTFGNDNDAGQFIQSREHDLVMVADALGIPPSTLGANINTSYKSLEADQRAFLNDIDAWLVGIEAELNRKLLSERQKELETHYIEFERKALIQIDPEKQSKLLVDQLNNGLISFTEARQVLNKPTDKDLEDGWRLPSNVKIEGDEPEPPPEPLMPQEDPQEAPEEDEDKPDDTEDQGEDEAQEDPKRALEVFTYNAVARLINRVRKSPKDPAKHRQVFLDNLEPCPNAKIVTDGILEELEAVLPEQREAILDKLNVHKLVGELWNEDTAP